MATVDPRMSNIAVVGGGAWGTTLAMLAHRAGAHAWLYVRRAEKAAFIERERRHPDSLPGIDIPPAIRITADAESALERADLVLLAIPTQHMRSAVEPLAGWLHGKDIVSVAKGLETDTMRRPTDILHGVLGASARSISALSGPNLAFEIASGLPAATVVACQDLDVAERVRARLTSDMFRIYSTTDVIGVELGGALKNIVAIAAGIGDGLKAGDNARAALMTRAIAEIGRLGIALGADPLTFAGLSGIGDLIATCSSPLSRNHQAGIGLAAGQTLDEILAGMSGTAEGVPTTRAARELAKRLDVDMPIVAQMYNVLFERTSPADAIDNLMRRAPRQESIR